MTQIAKNHFVCYSTNSLSCLLQEKFHKRSYPDNRFITLYVYSRPQKGVGLCGEVKYLNPPNPMYVFILPMHVFTAICRAKGYNFILHDKQSFIPLSFIFIFILFTEMFQVFIDPPVIIARSQNKIFLNKFV